MQEQDLVSTLRLVSKPKYRRVMNAIKRGSHSLQDIAKNSHLSISSAEHCCASLYELGLLAVEKRKYYLNFEKIRINYPPKIEKNHYFYRHLELIINNGEEEKDYKLYIKDMNRFVYLRIFDALRPPKSIKELLKTQNTCDALVYKYLKELRILGLVKADIRKENHQKIKIFKTAIDSFRIRYAPGNKVAMWYSPQNDEPHYTSIWYLVQGKRLSRTKFSI